MPQQGSELLRWYLALLRRDAGLRVQRNNATPMTLVQQDKARIQTLIAQSGRHVVDEYAQKVVTLKLKPDAQKLFTEVISKLEEARYGEKLIADYTSDLLCCFDADRIVTDVNLEFELVTGFQKLSIVGAPVDTIFVEEERGAFTSHLKKVREESSEENFESTVRRKDGSLIDLEWKIDWSSTSNSFFCRARNITERKERQRLRRKVQSLARHDLRTPLAGLGLLLENIQVGVYGKISDSGTEVLEDARGNIQRMVELIDKLIATTDEE